MASKSDRFCKSMCPDDFQGPIESVLLGTGGFGEIYKVSCDDQTLVAKKISHSENLDKEVIKKNITFAFPSSELWSKYVCQLKGFILMSHCTYLIYEYCEFGNLESLMAKVTITIKLRLKIMEDVAAGLAWISDTFATAHNDIKPANIVIDAEFTAKIADYGMRDFCSSLNEPLPKDKSYLHVAPELKSSDTTSNKNLEADIYSFGICVYNVFENILRYSTDAVDSRINNSGISDGGPHIETIVKDIVTACVNIDPSKRPTAKGILDLFKPAVQKFQKHFDEDIRQLRDHLVSKPVNGISESEKQNTAAAPLTNGSAPQSQAEGKCTNTIIVIVKKRSIDGKLTTSGLKEHKMKENRTLTKWLAKKYKMNIEQWKPSNGQLYLKFRDSKLATKFKEYVNKGHFSNYLCEHMDGDVLFEAALSPDAKKSRGRDETDLEPSALPSSDLESSTLPSEDLEVDRVHTPSSDTDSSVTGTPQNERESSPTVPLVEPITPTLSQNEQLHRIFTDEKSTYYLFLRTIEANMSHIKADPGHCPLIHACIVKNRTDLLRPIYLSGIWDIVVKHRIPNDCWPFLKEYVGNTVFDIAKLKSKNIEDDLMRYNEWNSEKQPLRMAIKRGLTRVISNVVDAAASPTIITDAFADGLTPLHWACVVGDLSVFKLLVKLGADVNNKTETGESILHLTCALGRKDIAKYIVQDLKMNTTERGPTGRSPVDYTAETGDVELFLILVSAKARIEYSALILSCMKGNAKFLKVMHGRCRLDLAYQDRYGRTPMHHAAENGHVDVMKYLIEKGAKLNGIDKNHRTMLHVLADRGHHKAILALKRHIKRHLLDQRDRYIGADNCFLVKGSDNGRPAFHYVEVKRKYIKIFLERTRGGNLDIANFGEVIRSGWGPEATTEDMRIIEKRYDDRVNSSEVLKDMTALHTAVTKEKWDVVPALIEVGADVNAKDHYGCTAMHIAAMKGHKATVQVLLNAGCDITIKDKERLTALEIAKANNNFNVQRLLQTITVRKIIKDELLTKFNSLNAAVHDESLSLEDLEERIVPSLNDISQRTQELLKDFGTGPVAEESLQT